MELANYIEETLVQIAQGAASAIERLGSMGALVNPIMEDVKGNAVASPGKEGYRMVQKVEFDIAVSIENKDGKTGRIAVLGGVLEFGGGVEKEGVYKHINTIKFVIPIALNARR